MEIYSKEDALLLSIVVDDSSYRYRAIKGDNSLILKFETAEHVDLPLGAYCTFQGERYTLVRPENIKKQHTRHFEYSVTFEAEQSKAKLWKFRNVVDGRLKFSLTAKPHEHLELFVANMNQRDAGWEVGECVEGAEKLINYNHDYCHDALTRMASEFETEYEIKGKRVSLKKVEYHKNNPLPLSYGKGNGFKSGVGRSNRDDNPPTEILYVQGGERNIDRSKYGVSALHLTSNARGLFDGVKFEGEAGFNRSASRLYVVDEQGLSIRRGDKQLASMSEDSLDATSIYPSRVGEVSAVSEVNAEKHFYDFADASIPATLDYEKHLIAGEKMTVIFQSGMLAGRELEVKYIHEAKGGKAGRRFEIVPQEFDGITMPDATFKPAVGDKYAVFHCMLPEQYVKDAELSLFKAGVRYLFDHEEERYTFTGELDGIWAKQRWEAIKDKLCLGGYIRFTDAQFQQEGVLVRIVGIKESINNPYSPTIELSNEVVREGVASEIKRLQSEAVSVEEKHKEAIQYAKRRFRDASETIAMLEGAIQAGLDNFSESISPIAVRTMSMLAGDESLQFRFIRSEEDHTAIDDGIIYNADTKTLTAPKNVLQHMTLGIDSITANSAKAYKLWRVYAFTSAPLTDESKKYYLYIKTKKVAGEAWMMLSDTALSKEDANYYYFLVGVLNSEYEGERSFARLYGYSEVLPGRITTEKIISADGRSYFDLAKNEFSLGGQLKFSPSEGLVVQNDGGAKDYIGLFRGEYVSGRLYYKGDEVTYTIGGVLSTYRYIHDTPTNNHTPQESTFWQVMAQGVKGADGRNGVDGAKGDKGDKGDRGEKGEKGERGEQGIQGLQGLQGAKGDQGIQGARGADGRNGTNGRGIASVIKQYYLSTSKDTQQGGSWVTTPPTWQANRYLWSREVYNYTDGTSTITPPTCSSEWEAVNLLEVGGRNFFGFRKGVTFDAENNAVLTSEVIGLPEQGGINIKITKAGESGIIARIARLGFERAGYYTLSCEMKCNRAITTPSLNINLCNSAAPTHKLSTEWQRISFTSYVNQYYSVSDYNGFVDVQLYAGHGLQVGDIIGVRNLMIERGNVASDYKQAEEDIQWEIENYNYLKALFAQKAGISNGIVFGGALHAQSDGVTRAFINGVNGKPAFAAGVSNYGEVNESYATAFDFDGSGHIGGLHFTSQGGVPKIYIADESGEERVTFSKGDLPSIAILQGGTAPSVEIPQQSPSLDFSSNSRTSQGVAKEWQSSTIVVNVAHGVLTMKGTLAVRLTGSDDGFGREDNMEVSENRRGTTLVGGTASPYFAHVRLELWQGSTAYKVVEEYVGGLTGQPEESVDRQINLTIHDLPTGNYFLRLSCYSEKTARATATFTMSEKLIVDFKKVDKRTHVAGNGIASFFDRDQWVYIANGILQACGKTNLPGVLFSGKVGKDSQVAYLWGIDGTSVFVQRHGIGSIRIYHSLNRLDYTIQLTIEEEWGTNPSNRPLPRIINVMEKNANNFLVYIREYNGKMVDEFFNFAVFGYN